MIRKRKVGGKTVFSVITHQTGKNMGNFSTRAQAEKRLAQIKKFRHKP